MGTREDFRHEDGTGSDFNPNWLLLGLAVAFAVAAGLIAYHYSKRDPGVPAETVQAVEQSQPIYSRPVDVIDSVRPFVPEVKQPDQSEAEPAEPTPSHYQREKPYSQMSYYERGYEEGYDDGYDDGWYREPKDPYCPAKDLSGKARKEFRRGYFAGYEEGYFDGFDDYEWEPGSGEEDYTEDW